MTNKKEEFKAVKKTVEAHQAFSEEETQKKAEEIEEVSEKMIEKEFEKESKVAKIEIIQKGVPKERRRPGEKTKEEILQEWIPKTKLGIEVKNGKITNIDNILEKDRKILEPEIIDSLINVKSDLISVGQAKGKFGGGKRRAWRQTQRKTKEGNVPTFSTMAVIGDENGHVGIGTGKAKETLPARDKSIRKAKLNLIYVERTCSAFDCACKEPHTVPFKVEGKAGSVRVTLIPAPQGTGLVVGNELKKVLSLSGIKDVYSRTSGRKRTTFNLVKACINALKKTNQRKKPEGNFK
ncbi:MAG: 30S ribosomal protein S5 [archaeon]